MIEWTTETAGSDNEILIFHLNGRLDAAECDDLFTVLDGYIDRGHSQLILDCRDLSFISSAGVGALVRIHTRMRKRGGDVRLARVQGIVADVLRLVMLDRLLQLYPSLREAIASYA